MPIVRRPLGAEAASGKFGDELVFMEIGGVPAVRSFAMPDNPQTAAQTTVRSRFASQAAAWAGLTEVQRTAWRNYATTRSVVDPLTGKSQKLSGWNLFVRLNCLALAAGGAALTEPPASSSPPAPATVALATVEGNLQVNFTPSPLGATEVLDVWLFGSASPGRRPGKGDFQHYTYSDAAKASPLVLFADPPAGYYTARVRVIDRATGLTSAWLRSEAFDASAL